MDSATSTGPTPVESLDALRNWRNEDPRKVFMYGLARAEQLQETARGDICSMDITPQAKQWIDTLVEHLAYSDPVRTPAELDALIAHALGVPPS